MQPAPRFAMTPARWRFPALALVLLFLQQPARADLWAFTDAWGVTYTASLQKDERYRLVYRDADAGRPERWNPIARQPLPPREEQLAFVALPRRFTGMDDSAGYKAVQVHLQAAASAHQVDYALLKAVVAVESGFQPNVVSPRGAVGLMQITPDTARFYGVQAGEGGLADPRTNIDAGARHLARLIKLFKGEVELAVAAYNAGETAVLRAGNKVPDYPETRGYVKNVMGLYAMFKFMQPPRS